MRPSKGSLEGRDFASASGDTIPNQGQQALPMQSPEGHWVQQRWQMAPVTKPLLSIGEECDMNKVVMFGRGGGAILNLEDGSVRRFPRVRGPYEMEMWIPPPPTSAADQGIPRQGAA